MPSYENMPLEEILKLPKLEAQMKWHNNYWDGPLSGVCTVNGELRWFDILIETDPESPCPKEEECDTRIQQELEEYEKTGVPVPGTTDEEWGCPDGYDHNCFAVPSYRYYGIYRIDDVTMQEVIRRHELFRAHVGTHTDYDETEQRQVGSVKSRKAWEAFYEPAKTWPELNCKQELVGYFVR